MVMRANSMQPLNDITGKQEVDKSVLHFFYLLKLNTHMITYIYILFIFNEMLLNFIVVRVQFSAFPPHLPPPQPSLPPSPVSTPLVFVHVSFIVVPVVPSPFSLHYPLPSPLWLLSVCSSFQCLWLYFAYWFILLIRFHLKIRSHGICLSLPGLLHLA